jgi:hypothetical protein
LQPAFAACKQAGFASDEHSMDSPGKHVNFEQDFEQDLDK